VIGIGSPTFCYMSFRKVLEEISEEFDMWEVLPEGTHRIDLIEDEIAYGRDSLGIKFQIHAPMSDVNIGSVYEPMRAVSVKEIAQAIEVSSRLGIETVTVHPGFVNGIAFLDKSKALEMTRLSLKEIDPIANNHSVIVAVENLPTNINATCTTLRDLLYAIEGTDLGICFDLGHANTANETDSFLGEVQRFKNVHLHNNDGQWDQHNRIDEGSGDLSKVISVLRKSYGRNIVIESTDLKSGVESKKVLQRLLG